MSSGTNKEGWLTEWFSMRVPLSVLPVPLTLTSLHTAAMDMQGRSVEPKNQATRKLSPVPHSREQPCPQLCQQSPKERKRTLATAGRKSSRV